MKKLLKKLHRMQRTKSVNLPNLSDSETKENQGCSPSRVETLRYDITRQNRYRSNSLPSSARVILAFQVVQAGFGFDMILYLFHNKHQDELWIQNTGEDGMHTDYDNLENGIKSLDIYRLVKSDQPSFSLAITSQASERGTCFHLLSRYCRDLIPVSAPGRFIAPGLLSKTDYDFVIGSIMDEIRSNRQESAKSKSEIISTAGELGLNPEPPFLSPGIWSATCPRTNHHLFLSSTSNTFGCGYCGKKGGPSELAEFVKERRKQEQHV